MNCYQCHQPIVPAADAVVRAVSTTVDAGPIIDPPAGASVALHRYRQQKTWQHFHAACVGKFKRDQFANWVGQWWWLIVPGVAWAGYVLWIKLQSWL